MDVYDTIVNAISTLGVPIAVMVYLFWKEKNLDAKLIESVDNLAKQIEKILDRYEDR